MRANDFTFDLMQVSLDFPNEGNTLSRYNITENTGAGFWNNSYKWLKQVKDMRMAAEKIMIRITLPLQWFLMPAFILILRIRMVMFRFPKLPTRMKAIHSQSLISRKIFM